MQEIRFERTIPESELEASYNDFLWSISDEQRDVIEEEDVTNLNILASNNEIDDNIWAFKVPLVNNKEPESSNIQLPKKLKSNNNGKVNIKRTGFFRTSPQGDNELANWMAYRVYQKMCEEFEIKKYNHYHPPSDAPPPPFDFDFDAIDPRINKQQILHLEYKKAFRQLAKERAMATQPPTKKRKLSHQPTIMNNSSSVQQSRNQQHRIIEPRLRVPHMDIEQAVQYYIKFHSDHYEGYCQELKDLEEYPGEFSKKIDRFKSVPAVAGALFRERLRIMTPYTGVLIRSIINVLKYSSDTTLLNVVNEVKIKEIRSTSNPKATYYYLFSKTTKTVWGTAKFGIGRKTTVKECKNKSLLKKLCVKDDYIDDIAANWKNGIYIWTISDVQKWQNHVAVGDTMTSGGQTTYFGAIRKAERK